MMQKNKSVFILITLFMLLYFIEGCEQTKPDTSTQVEGVTHPEWSKDANIYEVNIRQYTDEGTFNAFRKHLPRLQKMGVEILWLMPIHPIGEKNRKGTLGSYYSVKDYKGINPNFGTLDNFKALVDDAHQRGMKVILDWVANHTAWDHPWTETHPNWYTKDEEGNFKPPVEDWSDVIELNFENRAMRDAMVDAMKYWVQEANIDGYRCDVAGMVPNDFWIRVRNELDTIKPVFMLAEGNQPEHHLAFDMTYAWDFHFLMNKIATGDTALSVLNAQLMVEHKKFDGSGYRMMFTSNHDENTWKGAVRERLGKNIKPFAVMASTIQGMPLIYSGQEAGLDKRLEFFEKDMISWESFPLENFYTTLLKLKKENEALWNGQFGGEYEAINTPFPEDIFAYRRIKNDKEVLVVLNFGDTARSVALPLASLQAYFNAFTGAKRMVGSEPVRIDAHGYLVLHK